MIEFALDTYGLSCPWIIMNMNINSNSTQIRNITCVPRSYKPAIFCVAKRSLIGLKQSLCRRCRGIFMCVIYVRCSRLFLHEGQQHTVLRGLRSIH